MSIHSQSTSVDIIFSCQSGRHAPPRATGVAGDRIVNMSHQSGLNPVLLEQNRALGSGNGQAIVVLPEPAESALALAGLAIIALRRKVIKAGAKAV
jgi:hypothetical protein